MNKKISNIVLTFALCLIAVLTFPSIKSEAATKSSTANIVKLYKKGKYSKAIKMAKKLPAIANEKAVKKMSKKMKKAYLKKVKSFSITPNRNDSDRYLWDYYLTDIDNDGKAELIVKYGPHEAGVYIYIYTYKKGKAVKLAELPAAHTSFYAYPKKNGLIVCRTHMFFEDVSMYTLKKGKIAGKNIGGRQVQNTEDYINFPYALKSHISYKNGRTHVDYSDLK